MGVGWVERWEEHFYVRTTFSPKEWMKPKSQQDAEQASHPKFKRWRVPAWLLLVSKVTLHTPAINTYKMFITQQPCVYTSQRALLEMVVNIIRCTLLPRMFMPLHCHNAIMNASYDALSASMLHCLRSAFHCNFWHEHGPRSTPRGRFYSISRHLWHANNRLGSRDVALTSDFSHCQQPRSSLFLKEEVIIAYLVVRCQRQCYYSSWTGGPLSCLTCPDFILSVFHYMLLTPVIIIIFFVCTWFWCCREATHISKCFRALVSWHGQIPFLIQLTV